MVRRGVTPLLFSFALGCSDPGAELCDEPESAGGDEVGAARLTSAGWGESTIAEFDGLDRRLSNDETGSSSGQPLGFRNWGLEDPRVPVNSESDLQSYPLRTVALVRLQYPKKNSVGYWLERGTGFLVGPRHLLTNRHVVGGTWGDLNEWIDDPPEFFSLDVFPGRSSEVLLNGGAWAVERVIWNPFPETMYDDYALLILTDDEERSGQFGRMGLCRASKGTLDELSVFTAGYPAPTEACDQSPEADEEGCPCAGWMYFQSCAVEEVESQQLIHSCASQPGQSGSPLWVDECPGGTRCSVGIHYGKIGLDAGAVRWEDEDIDWLHARICEWPSDHAPMPPFCD